MPHATTYSRAIARRRGSKALRIGVAAASLSLVVGGTVSNSLTLGAQEAPPNATSAIGPYDPAHFSNGEASASGNTFRFNITQGEADIGLSYGGVLATYRDRTGGSDARALDLGVFTTLFGVEQCDGSPPILNPATFPPKAIADSNTPGSEIPKPTEAFMPGFGQGKHGERVGSQIATATNLPSSLASTESANADMFFIAITGGKSEATTSLKDHVREARSVVSAKQLKVLGGVFTFENPRWEAVARSGRITDVNGSFTFSRATVLGIPRTPEQALADLKGFKYELQKLLAPLGAKLELPQIVVNDNRVTVTPMSFKLVDPPFGKELLRPFFQNIQPLKEAWIKQQLDEDCKNEANLMMGDILLTVLAGSGSVEIHAGGTDAWTDDTDFSIPETPTTVPDGSVTTPGTPDVPATPDIPDSEVTTYTEGEWIDGTDPTYDYQETPPQVESTTETSTSVVPVSKVKKKPVTKAGSETQLVDSNALQETKGGTAAVAVGLAGLLGAIGLTFSEHLKERRTRRRIP